MNIQKLVFVVLLIFVSGCIHGVQTQSDSFGSGLIGEDPGGTPNNLMPIICQTAMSKTTKLKIF